MICGCFAETGRENVCLPESVLRNSAREYWHITLPTGKLFFTPGILFLHGRSVWYRFIAANISTRSAIFFSRFSASGMQRIHRAKLRYSLRTDSATWRFDPSTRLTALQNIVYSGRLTDSITCWSWVMWMKKIKSSFSLWECNLPSLTKMHSFVVWCEGFFR